MAEKKNDVTVSREGLLKKLDSFEENIRLLDILNKQYNDLKASLKKAMVEVGNLTGSDQVKWVTPKGTKITCTVGHCAEFEKTTNKVFDVNYLQENFPHIYEECCIDKEESIMVKSATSDTLRITLPKED